MTSTLPGVLGEIASVAGEPAAVEIAARMGGTRVYFPSRAPDDHWIVQAIGRDAADKVCTLLGGDRHDVPLATGGAYKTMLRRVAQQVHALDRAGKSSSEIARTVGLTQRAVHRHRAAHRHKLKRVSAKDPRGTQGSLF